MLKLQRLFTKDNNFWSQLDSLLAWDTLSDDTVTQTVRDILQNVRRHGDAALLDYTRQFDRRNVQNPEELIIPKQRLQQALRDLDNTQRQALEQAAERIRNYHQHQKQKSWQYTEADGTILGQQITPLSRVGLYVPGGKAAYPSSLLMNAIPAKVAEVDEIIMVVPAPDNVLNDIVLAAAAIAGVEKIFSIGGAQAIAALAYGTATVPKVDKIVGPGNIYVATAKSMVFGMVGIDMIAGPSEILVICDGQTNPDWIAMDLFSQAEHDEEARAILVSPDATFLDTVQDSMNRLIDKMPRAEIIRTSLTNRGALIQAKDLNEAIEVANFIAPEHLELSIENPQAWNSKIRHAGAIFMGRYTAEALGDYCAGPNHVLPTSRTARFSSPLGVYDFQKRSSLIMCSEEGAHTLGQTASILAYGEGLSAHAQSAEYRTT
ncbi:histidinol dehydrogenase [Candidatus Thiomargarita nelsonii]|uniref:Histidinol dehydrogenase n=1 Tax=Candidatus Thiomargarita nelsonii TaxID=1003181 RepID=A0A0A6RWE4_9GAMM|nr:histidinol dehydrogenase [Candidatus Thiomargarita nelsonii]